MNVRARLQIGILGMIVSIGGLAGCEGETAPVPQNTGAGIPTNRGPVSSKMPKGAPGNIRPAADKAEPK